MTVGSDEFVRRARHNDADLTLIEGFLPAERRQLLLLFEAVMHEVRQSCFHSSDSRVGQAKLVWWAEELLRMDAGSGSHPLSRALLALDAPGRVPAKLWQSLVNGALAQLDSAPALDFEQRAQQLILLSRPETEIRLRLSGLSVLDAPSGAAQAWVWIACWLWRLPEQAAVCDWLLPINLLARASCARESLQMRPLPADAGRLVSLMAASAASGLRESAADIAAGDVLSAARHALALHAVERLQRKPGAILSRPEQSRPLQRLWTTWRAARRQRAGLG